MKRWISILLAALMIFALTACGSAPAEPEKAEGSTAEETPETAAPEKQDTNAAYSLEETVLVDNEQCAVTINSVSESGSDVVVSLTCENKSDTVLMFACENAAVNGCMIDPFWASEVAAGKKSAEKLTFSKAEMKEYGLSMMDELAFDLAVYDSENYTGERIVDDRYTVYPTGLSADDVKYPEHQNSGDNQVIIDNDSCTFIITDVDPNNIWGYTVKAYVLNKTDSTVTCSWEDVSVNGFMCDPFWATSIAPGCCTLTEISFSDSQLEEINVESVDDIEFRLHVYDDAHWDNPFVDSVFTFNP